MHRKGVAAEAIPPAPYELEVFWRHFIRLSGRRQAGMAACALSISEIEAYERKFLVSFSPWETELICRLDDAILIVWSEQHKTPARPSDKAAEIPISDTENLRAMFRGLKTAKALEKAGEAKK